MANVKSLLEKVSIVEEGDLFNLSNEYVKGYLNYSKDDFRMYIGKNHKCLFVKIDEDNRIVVNEIGNRVSMALFGERTSIHEMETCTDRMHSPLIYLSLFIMNLNRSGYHDLTRYLLYKQKSKPFTSHLAFSPDYLPIMKNSSRESLDACYEMYRHYMEEDGFPISRELCILKPWNLYKDTDVEKYHNVLIHANAEAEKMEALVRDGSVSDLGDEESFEYEGLMLFTRAVEYDRLDIAAYLYGIYRFNKKDLVAICKEFKRNSVVKFVYSLADDESKCVQYPEYEWLENRFTVSYRDSEGLYHRDGEPAYVVYIDGILRGESWCRHGDRHREGGPAIVDYHLGDPIKEEWWIDDKFVSESKKTMTLVQEKTPSDSKKKCLHRKKPSKNNPVYTYFLNGKPHTRTWYVDGKIQCDHRDPARTTWYENGKVHMNEWFKNGVLHNDEDNPAVVVYDEKGRVNREEFWTHGLLSVGGPALITYDSRGEPLVIEYYNNNGLDHTTVHTYHNNGSQKTYQRRQNDDYILNFKDGPSFSTFYDNGKLESQMWYLKGVVHSESGPAVINYYPEGNISTGAWFKDGKRHRDVGPAVVTTDEDKKIVRQEWWVDGVLHRNGEPAVIK